jgi:hypothetical protein
MTVEANGRPETRRYGWPAGAPLVFLATLALYLSTLAPTVFNLDSAELTTAAYTGGILRSPGYPLYLLIGRVWSRLPIGDVGYRMNLLSAVCGALTVALAYRLARRLGVGPWPAATAVGLLAVSHYFWAMSSIAEVYTLHTAFVAALLLALVAYGERPEPKRLAVATLIVGLAFGNHVATVLLAPGCLLYVIWQGGRRALEPRSLAWAAGGLLAGLSVYLYLPLRFLQRPEFNYAGHVDATGAFVPVDLASPRGLWWLVSGRPFADLMLAVTDASLLRALLDFGAELWRVSLGIGIGAGLLGLASGLRRAPAFFAAVLAMFVVHAGFYLTYDAIDKATMFLPNHLLWVLLVAAGCQSLERMLAGERARIPQRTPKLTWALRAAIAGAVALGLLWNGRLVDLSRDTSARERGEWILRHVEEDALVVGWWNTVPVVEYLQLVEGRRPDVDAVNRFLIRQEDLSRLLQSEAGRRPVYSDETLVGIVPRLERHPFGFLFRLLPPSFAAREEEAPRAGGPAASGEGVPRRLEP